MSHLLIQMRKSNLKINYKKTCLLLVNNKKKKKKRNKKMNLKTWVLMKNTSSMIDLKMVHKLISMARMKLLETYMEIMNKE